MAKLTTAMCSVLTKTAIEKLNRQKIYTVLDVLVEDPKKLSSISKLAFKDVITLRQSLIANYTPLPRQGLDIYNDLLTNCSYIPSGIANLDKLLEGGFLTGNIVEICGLSASGKTQLCLTIASNIAIQRKSSIHYIDTKLDFSGKRVHDLIEARESNEELIGCAMEKILVTRVHDFFELYSFLYHLKNELVREPGSIRIILIDSIASIFLQYMGKQNFDGFGLLNSFACLLQYISHEHHVAIVVVNLASMWMEEDSSAFSDEGESASTLPVVNLRPVLGRYWVSVPNTRLFIEKSEPPSTRKISVIKSTHLPLGSFCEVSLSSNGIS